MHLALRITICISIQEIFWLTAVNRWMAIEQNEAGRQWTCCQESKEKTRKKDTKSLVWAESEKFHARMQMTSPLMNLCTEESTSSRVLFRIVCRPSLSRREIDRPGTRKRQRRGWGHKKSLAAGSRQQRPWQFSLWFIQKKREGIWNWKGKVNTKQLLLHGWTPAHSFFSPRGLRKPFCYKYHFQASLMIGRRKYTSSVQKK